jgi:hypothetical protein
LLVGGVDVCNKQICPGNEFPSTSSFVFFGGFVFLNQPNFIISIEQFERTVVACSVENLLVKNFAFFPQNAC